MATQPKKPEMATKKTNEPKKEPGQGKPAQSPKTTPGHKPEGNPKKM
ncbi:MAG: hypothetical protein ACF8PN_05100 [Phycisphaerales bacterium]